MDVMRPNLVWVDGACYRVNHAQHAVHQDEDPEDFIHGKCVVSTIFPADVDSEMSSMVS